MKIDYVGVYNDRYLLSYRPHPKYSDKYIGEFLNKGYIRDGPDLRKTNEYKWILDISLIDGKKQIDKFFSNGSGVLTIQKYEKAKMYDYNKQRYDYNSFLERYLEMDIPFRMFLDIKRGEI